MRSALGYLNLPTWTPVFAFGRFRSNSSFFNGWGYSALIQGQQHRIYEDLLCVSSLQHMGGIFRYPESYLGYNSHGVVGAFPFPSMGEVFQGQISDCPAAPKIITDSSNFSRQKCFCLVFDDVTVWLPKLELAGQLFFFDTILIESAFSPGSIDFNFCLSEYKDAIEIRAIPDIGISSWAFDQDFYRRRLAWLLTKKDVRDSFFSIWRSMNEEKIFIPGEGHAWDFNFAPPVSLSGANMTVMGNLSEDKKHLLVWEVVKVEIPITYDKEFIFIHPDLKKPSPVSDELSNSHGLLSASTDSVVFLGDMKTSVSYCGGS